MTIVFQNSKDGANSDRPNTTTKKSMIRNLLWIFGVITVCPLVYIAGECIGKGQQISLPVNQVLKPNGAPKESAKSFDTQKLKSQDGKSCSGKKLQEFTEFRKAWSLGVSKDEFNATCPVIHKNGDNKSFVMVQLCEDGVKRIIFFRRDTNGVLRVDAVNASYPADESSCMGLADETGRRMGEPPVIKNRASWHCDESSIFIMLGQRGDTCEFIIRDAVNN